MPNYITNRITGPREMLSLLFTADGDLDFNILIPAPEGMSSAWCAGFHGPDFICWYEWQIENWGTKWNGSSATAENLDGSYDESVTVQFVTAWAHPVPIIRALVKALPDNSVLTVQYADEDLGGNLGEYTVRMEDREDGMLTTNQIRSFTDYSPEACDFAARLIYDMSYEDYRNEFLL